MSSRQSIFRPGPNAPVEEHVVYLSRIFKLPSEYSNYCSSNDTCLISDSIELTSRSGLKETHMRFQYVATMLDLAFDAASSGKNNWDIPTLNAIAAIWSEMCADAVLCNKLLERGWSYSRLSEVR